MLTLTLGLETLSPRILSFQPHVLVPPEDKHNNQRLLGRYQRNSSTKNVLTSRALGSTLNPMQPNSRIWNKRRIQIKQCNGWMSWSQMYSLPHATDCLECMSAIKDQFNLCIYAIWHMNGNRHPCSVLQQHSKSDGVVENLSGIDSKDMAQTRSMAHVLQRILQFSLPSWLCQDRQERPITAAASNNSEIYWQDPFTGLQTTPLLAGAATDNFRIRGFHVPCDLLTSQGQNDLPSLEGMVAEFWFMHLKMLLPSSPTMWNGEAIYDVHKMILHYSPLMWNWEAIWWSFPFHHQCEIKKQFAFVKLYCDILFIIYSHDDALCFSLSFMIQKSCTPFGALGEFSFKKKQCCILHSALTSLWKFMLHSVGLQFWYWLLDILESVLSSSTGSQVLMFIDLLSFIQCAQIGTKVSSFKLRLQFVSFVA